MRLRRAIDGEASSRRKAVGIDPVCAGPLTCAQERAQCRCRGSVFNNTRECVRKTDHAPEPFHDTFLKFCGCRRSGPAHALSAHCCRQHLRENTGRTAIGGEVREEGRMLPVRHSRQDDLREVAEDAVEVFGINRRQGREFSENVTRCDRGLHGPLFDMLEVVGHPVDQLMRVAAELCYLHCRRKRPLTIPASCSLSRSVSISHRPWHEPMMRIFR